MWFAATAWVSFWLLPDLAVAWWFTKIQMYFVMSRRGSFGRCLTFYCRIPVACFCCRIWQYSCTLGKSLLKPFEWKRSWVFTVKKKGRQRCRRDYIMIFHLMNWNHLVQCFPNCMSWTISVPWNQFSGCR